MTGFDFSITYLSRCLDALRRTPCERVCRLKRILVVDDERSITFALQQYFAYAGFWVDCAWSGEEAQRYLAANQYDVAIVDVELRDGGAGVDGIDLAAFIRNSAPGTAVIILTAVTCADTRRRAEEAGVRSYLSKPARLAHVADIAIGLIERGTAAGQ
jgi:DNA-binding response OmpR family regulator